ncbi:MAG: formate dehydrogenase accessory sulfurtransferase FdhD, partial [Halobacteriota archaeon]|nr:formate dehydrogenase accessory sulfurtransferase FdhD [Halobacteriota archaeon]
MPIEYDCLKIKDNKVDGYKDIVVEEIPLSIFINGRNYATAMMMSQMKKEFVIGHLFSEGIIKSLDEIESIQIQKNTAKVLTKSPLGDLMARKTILSGCGGGSNFLDQSKLPKIESFLKIYKEYVLDAIKDVRVSELHKDTGGVHSCGLFEGQSRLYRADDIGRHNALDKVIGSGLIDGCDFSETFVVTTGRISSEMALKCSYANIPLIASMGATTSLAIDIADKTGLAIVGFTKGSRFNVYSEGHKRFRFGFI